MGFIGIFLLVLFLVSSLLLIVVVLLQDDQGDGIGGLFGGGSATPFGSRSGNVLTKATSILGAVFLLCSFGMAFVSRTGNSGDTLGEYRRQADNAVEEWWNAVPSDSENNADTTETATTAE